MFVVFNDWFQFDVLFFLSIVADEEEKSCKIGKRSKKKDLQTMIVEDFEENEKNSTIFDVTAWPVVDSWESLF